MLVAQKEVEAPQQLLQRLAEARVRTDEIFRIVRPNSLYERPIPERHRIIFYLGHLEAFDWNLLRERVLGLKLFDADLDQLFAFGIDPVNGALPADQPSDWPSVASTRGYVDRIRESIDAGLAALDFSDLNSNPTGTDYSASKLMNVAIEHRLMHAETLAYMLHQLPLERKVGKQRAPELVVSPSTPGMIEIPAGRAVLGVSSRDGAFGWDNEFEAQNIDVPVFAIDKYKVTNREYLDFMAAGGYDNPEFWTEDDWNWRTSHDIRRPVFWTRNQDRWYCRTMFDEIPLPLEWPVYVSHAEASAYARWANKSLPTEAQWHRAAYGTNSDRIMVMRDFSHGATMSRMPARVISISTVGIRLRSMLFLMAIAHSASPICWAMDGSGPPAGSNRFLASDDFRFIPATPPISSTANTM